MATPHDHNNTPPQRWGTTDLNRDPNVGPDADRSSGPVSERLARFMFDMQADGYDADDAMRELAWGDDNVHEFWLGQADAVVSFLGLGLCA